MTIVSNVSNIAKEYSSRTLALIGVCFIGSGATALIYEVLWMRLLGLVFGATTLAVSTVLAAFMGGLALGSAIAARYGPRISRPLRVYGLMEVALALYALSVPLLFRLVDATFPLIWQKFHPAFFTFSLWRFALSILVLLIPTSLMGATLPVLSQAVVHSCADVSAVARLYAKNLTGAILGTVAAGFILLPQLGMSATILFAASINILIGLIAIFFAIETELSSPRSGGLSESTGTDGTSAWLWYGAALVSGFVTMSTQVTWTRLLSMVIGSSTYAFSIVVALFLIGLSGGAWMVGRIRVASWLRTNLLIVEVATAVSLYASLMVINWIPSLLVSLGLKLKVVSWVSLLGLQVLAAGLLILLPAILMGMVVPLVLTWANKSGVNSVSRVGRIYAVNTLGAISGAFFTGFVLIPQTSTKFTILFAATLCLLVAPFAYEPAKALSASSIMPSLKRASAAGLTVLAVFLLLILSPRLNVADLSIGAYDSLIRLLAQTREGVEQETTVQSRDTHQLLMFAEGATSTVSVRLDQGTTSLAINGRTNASDSAYDMPMQVMLGQAPILIAPELRGALIIGYATGVSLGSMLQSPIQSVTCVELEQGTVSASRFFEHVNNKPLADPRARLVIDDARTYLRGTLERYDIIASEPSHPWVPGVANLFTREFFQIGKDRLSESGVFVQWLQIYQLSTDSLRSILATYHTVFPHVMVFRIGGASSGKDLILIGSNSALNLDRVAERLADMRVKTELQRINVTSVDDVKSMFVCDESTLGPAVQGAVINTDDNMHIETTVPREAFRPLMQSNAQWLDGLMKK